MRSRTGDSVLASIGHGGLKEGQVINKMLEERNKKLKKEETDATILDGISAEGDKVPVLAAGKSQSGIVVKGFMTLRYGFPSRSPVPGMRSLDLLPAAEESPSTGRTALT